MGSRAGSGATNMSGGVNKMRKQICVAPDSVVFFNDSLTLKRQRILLELLATSVKCLLTAVLVQQLKNSILYFRHTRP
jgi:hypothetical protein